MVDLMLVLLVASCGPKTAEEKPTTPTEKTPAVLPTLAIGETGKVVGVEVTVLGEITFTTYTPAV